MAAADTPEDVERKITKDAGEGTPPESGCDAQPSDAATGGNGTSVTSGPSRAESEASPTSGLFIALTALQAEARRNYDRLLRTAADFENYKKRARRESKDAGDRAEERVVLAFLQIFDNLERALEHAERPDVGDRSGLIEGVKMVFKQYVSTLEQFGIVRFDSLDKSFDPESHEAIQQAPSDKPRNTVISELQKGYKRGDRLVRPALVVVSLGPAESPVAEGERSDSDPGGAVKGGEQVLAPGGDSGVSGES
jgi:molecular chaperone GrpE